VVDGSGFQEAIILAYKMTAVGVDLSNPLLSVVMLLQRIL
jgi:hypothetical protein